MWSLRTLHKWLAGLVFLTTLVSFTGIPVTSTHSVQVQTELLIEGASEDVSTWVFSHDHLLRTVDHSIDQYTVFNFKCLLFSQGFDLKITLKSQKKVELQIQNLNSLQQQNLIAKVHSSFPHLVL